MKDKIKEYRDAAVKVIEDEAIIIEMDYIALEGKISRIKYIFIFLKCTNNTNLIIFSYAWHSLESEPFSEYKQ